MMWKRTVAKLILAALLLTALPVIATAEEVEAPTGDLANFKSGKAVRFVDVPKKAWFAANVDAVSAAGLMTGVNADHFTPQNTLTTAEAVTVAARFHAIYYTGSADTVENRREKGAWYNKYFAYLTEQGLLDESIVSTAGQSAKRELIAVLLAETVEQKDLKEINLISGLPDCSPELTEIILPLYKAGVLTGNDGIGTFAPTSSLKRCELAAIVSRLTVPKLRKKVNFAPFGEGSMELVADETEYDGRFTDIGKKQWYTEAVSICFQKGLMSGVSRTKFNIDGTVTVAETVTVAARLHCRYRTGSTEILDRFPSGKNWYDRYYSYLSAAGCLPGGWTKTPSAPATREQTLEILCAVCPANTLKAVNDINVIPDYFTGRCYNDFLALYTAGVLTGSDKSGSLRPFDNVRRSEAATLLARLVVPEQRVRFTTDYPVRTRVLRYGKSGAGRDLECYRIGTGKNVLVMTFEVHGWEDSWARDGEELVNTGKALAKYLVKNPSLVKNWSVYILPQCNPDGLIDGTTCNGCGRCTVFSYDAKGKLIRRGADINRSFPYGYTKLTDARNYNGPAPLSCPEAKGIQDILLQAKISTGKKYYVDVHGWYNQIITAANADDIKNAFCGQFGGLTKTAMSAHGYACEYASGIGYAAGLFEFPYTTSHNDFVMSGYQTKLIRSVCTVLTK